MARNYKDCETINGVVEQSNYTCGQNQRALPSSQAQISSLAKKSAVSLSALSGESEL
jgi:hypothetical protein